MLKNWCNLSFRGVRQPTDDEESRKGFNFRTRFLAKFTLSGQSEILRFAQNDKRRDRNDSVDRGFSAIC